MARRPLHGLLATMQAGVRNENKKKLFVEVVLLRGTYSFSGHLSLSSFLQRPGRRVELLLPVAHGMRFSFSFPFVSCTPLLAKHSRPWLARRSFQKL